MKTTRFTCSRRAGGMVPVLHDVDELHAARCQPVETMTVGTSSYVLHVTNPPSVSFWTNDEGVPMTEDGQVIVWSV